MGENTANLGTYVDLMSDFGFKKIFGEKSNRKFLIDFLNALFGGEIVVEDVKYDNPEYKGKTRFNRGMVYDVYCHTEEDGPDGKKQVSRHFIIEMQRAHQEYFDNRAVYYVANALSRQGKRGSFDFHLVPVFGIYLMDFYLNGKRKGDDEEIVDLHMLMNTRTHKPLNDVMRLYFIKLPLIRERAEDCKNDMERWLYCIKNLKDLKMIPFNKKIFKQLEDAASVANLTPAELETYERELKYARDHENQIRTALKEGREEGREEGRWATLRENVLSMLEEKLTESQIARFLHLGVDEVHRLANDVR